MLLRNRMNSRVLILAFLSYALCQNAAAQELTHEVLDGELIDYSVEGKET
jgi:hypothetical protein